MNGPAGIPISEKLAFCQLYRVQSDLIPMMITVVDRLNEVYLDYMEKKRRAAERSSNGQGSSSRN